jgi:hypothetical protein
LFVACAAAHGAEATCNAPVADVVCCTVASVARELDLPCTCGRGAECSVLDGWLLRRPRRGDQSFRPETEAEPEEKPVPTGTAW